MMTRRQAIKTAAITAAAASIVPQVIAQAAAPAGPFTLPPLPYAFDALEPHIDAKTMEIHHDRHHKAYVDNLNKAVVDFPDAGKKSVEELVKDLNSVPEKIRTAVRNNGGGHYNHSLFWQMMSKSGGGEPKGELAKAIDASFGSFSAFKDAFAKAGLGQFGSGWAWLIIDAEKKLKVISTPNQDATILPRSLQNADNSLPLPALRLMGSQPLLGVDVWEHAYYLKYQNKRADYIAAWWNVVNWDFVTESYLKAKG